MDNQTDGRNKLAEVQTDSQKCKVEIVPTELHQKIRDIKT